MGRVKRKVAVSLSLLIMLFMPLLADARSYPGKITVLPNEKFYEALSKGIRSAKKDIKGCFFLFKVTKGRSNLPGALAADLVSARQRGVAVSVELEQDASGRGSVYEQNRKAAVILLQGGVKVRFDTPKTTTHVKAMVIDGRYVYLGSHNLTQSALLYNNELSVMIDSPEVANEVGSYLDNL